MALEKIFTQPFEIKYHHRYDLRDWLRNNFPFIEKSTYKKDDLQNLEKRASEIVDACSKIEQIDIRSGSAYVKYYAQDWKAIKDAYQSKDYRTLAQSLNTLLDAIDVE